MADDKWVEIISVRLSGPGNTSRVKEVIDHIRSGRCPKTGNKIAAELYVNQNLESDWAIHLVRNRQDLDPGKTILGSNIAELFSSLGLANHTVWESAAPADLNQNKV